MKKAFYLLLAIAVVWFVYPREERVRLGPGVFAPDPPTQEKIALPEKFAFEDYTITPLARFHVVAKVLSRRNYRWGREADLSPVDLALGWGRMSDESVVNRIEIWQSSRWYRWQTDAFPIPRREIETYSGNMHLIPANGSVESAIDRACTGHIVEFSGSLVRVDGKDGWRWVSSLSRKDTGDHSCELVYVEKFTVHESGASGP
jgi:hypothetical protein